VPDAVQPHQTLSQSRRTQNESRTQHSRAQHSTAQHSTTEHSTAQQQDIEQPNTVKGLIAHVIMDNIKVQPEKEDAPNPARKLNM